LKQNIKQITFYFAEEGPRPWFRRHQERM